MKKICPICSEEFELKSSRQKFCNKEHEYICKCCGKSFRRACMRDTKYDFCDDCKSNHWIHICAYCGKPFLTDVYQKTICDRKHYKECPQCHKQFIAPNDRLYDDMCCSTECSNLKRKTNIKKAIQYKPKGYNYPKTIKTRVCKLCGKEFQSVMNQLYCDGPHYRKCVICGNEFEVDKSQIANNTNYCSDECRVRYSLQTQLGKDKEQLWHEFCIDPKMWIDTNCKDEDVTYYLLNKKLGMDKSTIQQQLKKHNLENLVTKYVSTMEQEVFELFNNEVAYLLNDRNAIKPYELDIYIPSLNFAIECDPTYTHNSSDVCHDEPPKPTTYHKMKSDMCESKGINLLHIFGYDWEHKRPIIESIIKTRLKIADSRLYARNCNIVLVDYKECKEFLSKNHLQGNVVSKVRLGLKYNDELVSVMTFGATRHTIGKHDDNTWELLRYCSKLDTSVVGGASKLFKYFIKTYNPTRVISFSDVAHTTGNLYPILGFKYLYTSEPGYVWVDTKTNKAYNRINAQKQNIKKFLKDDSVDLSLSESQIMKAHGFVKVYDSGNKLWEWTS